MLGSHSHGIEYNHPRSNSWQRWCRCWQCRWTSSTSVEKKLVEAVMFSCGVVVKSLTLIENNEILAFSGTVMYKKKGGSRSSSRNVYNRKKNVDVRVLRRTFVLETSLHTRKAKGHNQIYRVFGCYCNSEVDYQWWLRRLCCNRFGSERGTGVVLFCLRSRSLIAML